MIATITKVKRPCEDLDFNHWRGKNCGASFFWYHKGFYTHEYQYKHTPKTKKEVKGDERKEPSLPL